jgi:hypothetical protein
LTSSRPPRRSSDLTAIGRALLLWGTLALAAPASADPRYLLLRYDEDWSQAESPKRIALADGAFPYLTVGGEARFRYEKLVHPAFGAEVEDPDGYLLQRHSLLVDLHWNERVRLFSQLQSSTVSGRRAGPRPTDRDDLDLQQFFVDAELGRDGARHQLLRIGRQEIELGSARLISVRDGLNLRQTHDGARFIDEGGDWYLTGFVVRPVVAQPGIFDDDVAPAGFLWALAGLSTKLPDPFPGLVLFYHGIDRETARYDIGTARETRHLVGFRTWGAAKAPWELEVSVIGQFGSFGARDIRAWGMTSDLGYSLGELPWQPRLGLKGNVASGDTDRADDTLGTYNALYTATAYSGLAGLLGPSNVLDLTPTLSARPDPSVLLSAWTAFYWRYTSSDGVYGIFNNLAKTGARSEARRVGSQSTLQAVWFASPQITLAAIYAHFFAGTFLEETPPGKDVDYGALQASLRF